MEEKKDRQRDLGCVYPGMWGRPCVVFLPRNYYSFIFFTVPLVYLVCLWLGIGLFLTIAISALYIVVFFIYGLIKVRHDSFVFDILVSKFDLGSTQHSFRRMGFLKYKRIGNVYYSRKF